MGLALRIPQMDEDLRPTHWSFSQLCQQVKAPASYLRTLSPKIAGICMQYGLATHQGETMKLFYTENGVQELRAATSPTYGRVLDADVVDAVCRVAGDGTWKVPGVMDWSAGTYDPDAPVDKRSTTLYASDRDVFVFLCRDQFPIEIGKLADGSPDLLFPGFIVSNSETGAGTLVIETMYLRAVCMNRNLWGCEHHSTLRIIHRSGAPSRFAVEAKPALEQFSQQATLPVIAKVTEAKKLVVAKDEDERREFLQKQGFGRKVADQIVDQFVKDEGRNPNSIWDMVQGITAHARDIPHQDARIDVERKAGALMDKVAA